jgi:diguanylate cyclase (GGDEF)-like protein/PAS domain S-box-containing protein
MKKLLNTLYTLWSANSSGSEVVKRLYCLSQQSLVALIGFAFFVTYVLYQSLHLMILGWAILLVCIALARLGLIYYFKHNESSYSAQTWYRLFVFLNFTTAAVISLPGFVHIHYVDALEQLFIVAALVGLTGGAISSLFPDVRIMLGYNSIILLPLTLSMFALGSKMHMILAAMLILYFITQFIIALNVHKQNTDLKNKKEEIIATQAQLLKNKESLEYFYTQAPIGIFSYDMDLKIIECNNAFLNLFHLKKEDMIGMDLHMLPDKSPLDPIREALNGEVQTYVGPYLSMKGMEYWVEAKCFPVHDESNQVIGGIVLLENKTKEHKAVQKLKYLASHDTLTKLSNRRGFKAFMESMLEEPKHKSHYSLLFYLDLNRFKYINDSLGHTFGDKLLIEVANRLQVLIGKENNLTRLGGDEFVIVIPFVAEEQESAEIDARREAERIRQAFEEAFIIDGARLYIKTSIGIVIVEPGFKNVEEIVRFADISMYQAKKHGHEQISFYNTKLDEERKEIFALQQDLVYALGNDLFELYLQPILNINDDSVNAAEALIRWNHPKRGLLQPVDFIPLAIELGVVTEIGWWVLKKVCQTIALWKEQGAWKLDYISINLNAKQLIKEGFIEQFFEQLAVYNTDTKDIKVEITETSLIDNFELTQQVIHELQSRGIKCVIDDFGTGYSSLSYLKKLSFSVLKIDKEFIFDLEHNEDNETLIRTIVEIAKQFNYSVVVEGIETSEQKEIIRSIDHHVSYQGFLTSKPIPIEDFKKRFIEKEEGAPQR